MSEKHFSQPPNTQAHFTNLPNAQIERSKFDRSNGLKTTFDAGELIPVYCDEVLPGDTFHMESTAFARLATPLKPIMDNMYLDTHFFFVPYRLVWDNWVHFMGERKSTTDSPDDYSIPQTTINLKGMQVWELAHHLGLPLRETNVVHATGAISVSALPFRAYCLIYNEWYREQNTQNPQPINFGDGPDSWDGFSILHRNKRHDYFTSCLPWPQKGDPVLIPLGDFAPVLTDLTFPTTVTANDSIAKEMKWATISGGQALAPKASVTGGTGLDNDRIIWSNTGMQVDLRTATAVSINDLRTAFQIQKLLERDARGGTRYIELILSHFGVASDDARLQRPEYLGGGTAMVNVNPIANTAPIDGVSAVGQLAAYGTVIGKGSFSKSFTEHGIILGMVSVRADLTYQQGIERFWSRKTRYDFYWPSLSHLGEQAVLNKEIFVRCDNTFDDTVFGYQERYAEYRYKPSRIAGEFHSEHPTSLDMWHLAQDFTQVPPLNWGFFLVFVPLDRCIAVPAEPHFLCDMWFKLICERPMPVYAVPGLIDHF